jgi:hypothetical protein
MPRTLRATQVQMKMPLAAPAHAAWKQTRQSEEVLVQDDRALIRPAQMVDNKLCDRLRGAIHLVSQLRLKELIGRR